MCHQILSHIVQDYQNFQIFHHSKYTAVCMSAFKKIINTIWLFCHPIAAQKVLKVLLIYRRSLKLYFHLALMYRKYESMIENLNYVAQIFQSCFLSLSNKLWKYKTQCYFNKIVSFKNFKNYKQTFTFLFFTKLICGWFFTST